MSTVRPKFRDTALTSGLVSDDHLRAAIQEIVVANPGRLGAGAEITDKELAAKLVSMKILSAYQADQLLSGRSRLRLGPYIITDWIGQGGMGQVFKATHEMLGRECAIKVLPINKRTPEAIENFRREIRAQARLDHPNLVRAFDAGVDRNVHYLVVEYVPGTDLRRLVRSKGKLSVHQAAKVIKQAAEGLAHAHERGLIHRDIKPGNILVTPEGTSKLSDLGLAFCLSDPDDPRAGKIVGTADYLSPEQIRNPQLITAASDIYSLGCTLYYAVSGKVPYPGGSTKSKARRHLDETPWHPRRFNEEVSDEFVDLIGDMMEKDPEARIQSALEVAERLAPWVRDDESVTGDAPQRSRWTPAPVPRGDSDTDPNDIAELALSELSGISETSHGALGTQIIDSPSRAVAGSGAHPQLSVARQMDDAGHLPKDPITVSLTTCLLTGLVCLCTGVIFGFLIGFLMPH
ncbi:MAG TPA: serine/threonine-protein kinase [Pirellulaceae bacterium]|nr:serine/threonine-protein kinase [Pirellulaceae bacterium]